MAVVATSPQKLLGRARQRLALLPDAVWRHPKLCIGAAIVLALALIALGAPLIAPYDPTVMQVSNRLRPPSAQHWFGTDEFGRDVFTRVLYGARVSLGFGVAVTLLGIVVGTLVGLLAGYYGRWVDLGTQWAIDVLLAFPGLLLALAIIAILGPGLLSVMVAVAFAAIPYYGRLVRGQVLAIKHREFVEAARAIGVSDLLIIWRHILPNIVSPLVVLWSLDFAAGILALAGLSFLGLGAQPPTPEWGAMLSNGRDFLRDAWWIATFPGLALTIAVFGFNMLGEGLRDLLDPRG
jgi:peptide/nickel transport system permease protein